MPNKNDAYAHGANLSLQFLMLVSDEYIFRRYAVLLGASYKTETTVYLPIMTVACFI